MQWWLLRAHDESEAEYDRIVADLSEQLKVGKQSLWQAHEEVSDILNNGVGSVGNNSVNNFPTSSADGLENSNPQDMMSDHNMMASYDQKPSGDQTTVEVGDGDDSGALASSSSHHQRSVFNNNVDTIHIEIVAGEYEGMTFDLQPKGRVASYVGRSQGRKFKEKGISLSKDLEVSTTHGKFESNRGKYYYTDMGSTNGSLIDGCEIEASKAYELRDDMHITCGQTIMRIMLTAGGPSSSSSSSN
jgi:FHA domain